MGVCGINVHFFCYSSQASYLTSAAFFSFEVTFRMVMFRPFVSEVILAKVKSSDEDGIRRMLVWLLTVPYLIFVPRSFGWVLR